MAEVSHVTFLARRAKTLQRTCMLRMAKCLSRTERLLEERVYREVNARRKRNRWWTAIHRRRDTDERGNGNRGKPSQLGLAVKHKQRPGWPMAGRQMDVRER